VKTNKQNYIEEKNMINATIDHSIKKETSKAKHQPSSPLFHSLAVDIFHSQSGIFQQ